MSTFESNIAMVTVTAILLNPEIRICFEESSFLSDSIGLFPNMMIIKVYIFQNLITCYKKEEKYNVRISINRKFIILIQKMITLGVCVKFFLTVFHILLKPLFRRPCLLVFISLFHSNFLWFWNWIFFVSVVLFPFCFVSGIFILLIYFFKFCFIILLGVSLFLFALLCNCSNDIFVVVVIFVVANFVLMTGVKLCSIKLYWWIWNKNILLFIKSQRFLIF